MTRNQILFLPKLNQYNSPDIANPPVVKKYILKLTCKIFNTKGAYVFEKTTKTAYVYGFFLLHDLQNVAVRQSGNNQSCSFPLS